MTPLTDSQRKLVEDYYATWGTPMRFILSKRTRAYRTAISLGHSADDIEQHANLYILQAAKKYDLARGASFSTFAHYYVWSSLSRLIDMKTTKQSRAEQKWMRLDKLFGESGDEYDAHNFLAREHHGHDAGPDKKMLAELVNELPPQMASLIRLRYGLDGRRPMTLRELGRLFRFTKSRALQVQDEALGLMRDSAARRGHDAKTLGLVA